MIIRKATMQDCTRIKELLMQLGYDLPIEQVKSKVSIYLETDMYEILVAEENEVVLGLISVFFYESFCYKAGSCMHIETLIIDENARGKDVGNQLVQAIEKQAQRNNCEYSELLTLELRRKDGTHNFYEKLGYKDQDKAGITYFVKSFT